MPQTFNCRVETLAYILAVNSRRGNSLFPNAKKYQPEHNPYAHPACVSFRHCNKKNLYLLTHFVNALRERPQNPGLRWTELASYSSVGLSVVEQRYHLTAQKMCYACLHLQRSMI